LFTELIFLFGIFNLVTFTLAIKRIKNGSVFEETPYLSWLGIFVWGDAIVISPFWIICALVGLIFKNGYLFLFLGSLFWVARSLGEVIYWLNQQFSNKLRNPPEKLFLYFLLKNDSVWFVYQVFWQCMFVFAVVGSVYFGWKWIGSL